MKTVIVKNESKVKLGVTGVPEEMKKRLLEDYYTEIDGAYVRSYPAETPNIDKIAASFKKYGTAFISQTYGNAPAPWQDALLAFLKKIQGQDIEWLLIGSCALTVRGIDIKPRGVDFVMRMKDLEKARELFAETTIVPFAECSDWVCLAYGSAFLGAQIGIGFEPQDVLDKKKPSDAGPYAMAHAEIVEWKGYQVRVPPIELSLAINKARGRNERAALIERFIGLSLF